jgi:hypothetical protein
MGIILTVDGVAEATAPMLVAYMRDRQGSYDGGFVVLIAAAVVGALAVALLPRRAGSDVGGSFRLRSAEKPGELRRDSPEAQSAKAVEPAMRRV